MIIHWKHIEKIKKVQILNSFPSHLSFHHMVRYENEPLVIQFPISYVKAINRNWMNFEISFQENLLNTFICQLSNIYKIIHKKIESQYAKPINWDTDLEKISCNYKKMGFNGFFNQHCKIFDDNKNDINVSL